MWGQEELCERKAYITEKHKRERVKEWYAEDDQIMFQHVIMVSIVTKGDAMVDASPFGSKGNQVACHQPDAGAQLSLLKPTHRQEGQQE